MTGEYEQVQTNANPPESEFKYLYYYNFSTAFIHAVSAITVLILTATIQQDSHGQINNTTNHTSVLTNHTVLSNHTDVIGPYIASVCYEPGLNDSRPIFDIQPEQKFDLRVYFGVLITIFFALSAIFQFGQGISFDNYKTRVETNDVNYLRYIEYSLSASVMMVAIACALMVYDIYTHILIFFSTMLCMMMGLVADHLRMVEINLKKETAVFISKTRADFIKDISHLKWFTHGLGWIAILAPYGVFFGSYFGTVLRTSDCLKNLPPDTEPVPWWVHLIIFVQFVLFSSFGIVQILQFISYPKTMMGEEMFRPVEKYSSEAMYPGDVPYNTAEADLPETDRYAEETRKIGETTERRFITLSIIAKTLLGWLIAANIF